MCNTLYWSVARLSPGPPLALPLGGGGSQSRVGAELLFEGLIRVVESLSFPWVAQGRVGMADGRDWSCAAPNSRLAGRVGTVGVNVLSQTLPSPLGIIHVAQILRWSLA